MAHSTVKVKRLALYLPGQNYVTFNPENIHGAREETKLTEFFKLNARDASARQFTYIEMPEHYTYNMPTRRWKKRKLKSNTIARTYSSSPKEGERFFLRLLLLHVKGPTSFDDLKTVDNIIHPTFKAAAIALNLFEDDSEWDRCLEEASHHCSGKQLRELFSTI